MIDVLIMNYLDLFSGIGGFHLGLLQASFKFDYVGFSEIDKYAKQIYQKHFPESEDLGDVRTIDINRLPKINLITFGFPCQDLSIAGKRGGLSASRSGLFFEAMQIIGITRPNYFIFENVKGLFSSNEGRDWITILREIANIGYDGQWQLLNTRCVLPQNRERIYFVGHIRGECRPEIFPIQKSNKLGNVLPTISAGYRKRRGEDGVFIKIKEKIRFLTEKEIEYLQGFPINWTESLSTTQRYKCLGNAVTVPIVKLIAEKLKKYDF